MSKVEDCMNRLSTTLEKFKVCPIRIIMLVAHSHSPACQRPPWLRPPAETSITTREDPQHVADKVDNMDTKMENMDDKMDDIHQFLLTLKRSALLPSDTFVRQQMPLKPEIFHGRDDLVQEIGQLLVNEETSRVCILAPGGMGKTSVSLAVVELPLVEERFPPGNRFWVPCVEATSAALLLDILHTQLQISGDKHVNLEKIISELDASTEPRLILLDNFETPWNAPTGTQKQVGDILRQLAMLSHVAILVTMRGSYPPCDKAIEWQSKDIRAVDDAACFRIYHDINPDSEDDPDVGSLLSALGHMPFAVTLMANLGKQGQSTAKEFLDA